MWCCTLAHHCRCCKVDVINLLRSKLILASSRRHNAKVQRSLSMRRVQEAHHMYLLLIVMWLCLCCSIYPTQHFVT